MKSICTFLVFLSLTVFTSCGKSAGPESDPSIEIEVHSTKLEDGTLIIQKTCKFEAVIVEDQFYNKNRIKVRPISKTWDDEFWVYGHFSGWIPSLETIEGSQVTIAGYAVTGSKHSWYYFIVG